MVSDQDLLKFLDRLDTAIGSLSGLQLAADRLRQVIAESADPETRAERMMRMSNEEFAEHKKSRAVSK